MMERVPFSFHRPTSPVWKNPSGSNASLLYIGSLLDVMAEEEGANGLDLIPIQIDMKGRKREREYIRFFGIFEIAFEYVRSS